MSERDQDKEIPRPHLPALRPSEPHDDLIDSRASDDEILRRAGVPEEDLAGLDDAFKKHVADEVRGYGVHAGAEQPAEGTREAPVEVNAEFTDLPKESLSDRYKAGAQRGFSIAAKAAVYGVLALGALYLVFGRGGSAVTVAPPPIPAIPGWNDLASCAFLTSLDDRKELTLTEEQGVELVESAADEGGTKPESRSLQGTWSYDAGSKRYSVTLDGETTNYTLLSRGEPTTCILFKGDLGAADLRASWFSFPSNDEVPDYH